VVKEWENSTDSNDPSIRRIIFRTGIVLGKESQTIKKILPVFKVGLGGKISSGSQPFPFVHITDVVNAFFWAVQNKEVNGIYNLVAPEDINNEFFTKTLSKKLRRPAIFPVPEAALKLIYGEAATLMTESPQVKPERLQDYGFRFKFQNIESCLDEILQ
jgi:uncharacterized protein (TIGR01777 family)